MSQIFDCKCPRVTFCKKDGLVGIERQRDFSAVTVACRPFISDISSGTITTVEPTKLLLHVTLDLPCINTRANIPLGSKM